MADRPWPNNRRPSARQRIEALAVKWLENLRDKTPEADWNKEKLEEGVAELTDTTIRCGRFMCPLGVACDLIDIDIPMPAPNEAVEVLEKSPYSLGDYDDDAHTAHHLAKIIADAADGRCMYTDNQKLVLSLRAKMEAIFELDK